MTEKKAENARLDLAIEVKEQRCTGCVACMKACPTKAIRLRNRKPIILPELCVECGECIRACPQRAVAPKVLNYRELASFKVTALLPSRVLYTQFGESVMPNDILLALKKMGFDYVFDGAYYCEWVTLAAHDWLAKHTEVRTAIAPTCPVVLRLIAKRFPELIPNIIPIAPPREVAAKHIRRLLIRKLGLADEEIGVFHVTPCAANIASINHPLTVHNSALNGCLGLHDLFGGILKNLKKITDEDRETMLFKAGGAGIGWGLSREQPEITGGGERMLYVSGLNETMEVLDQISSGRLADFRYVECYTCPDGCLGGPLTVDNRFTARATLAKLIKMFGTLTRVRPGDVEVWARQGFFQADKQVVSQQIQIDRDPRQAMIKLKKMNELTKKLPGMLCGACGAPDCRTLAEDVVLDRAEMSDCPFYANSSDTGKEEA